MKKVAGKGAGAGMLRNIPLLLDITRNVVKAVNVPVTVKTRLGWDSDNLVITELAEQLQDCGIQALTIHGRTRSHPKKLNLPSSVMVWMLSWWAELLSEGLGSSRRCATT